MSRQDQAASGPGNPQWFAIDPARNAVPLTPAQSDRAGGVLLAMAVFDNWSRSTEIALCVADAAATGKDLADVLVLSLLQRNFRGWLREHSLSEATLNADAVLASSAVVALSHLHDSADDRARATRAVLGVLEPTIVVDDSVLDWVELVARVVRDGSTTSTNEISAARTGSESARIARNFVRAAELSGTSWMTFSDTNSISLAPAAIGALMGARFGWRAVPDISAREVNGWPGTDAEALVGLGVLAATLKRRSVETPRDSDERSGGSILIESWETITSDEDLLPPEVSPTAPVWGRSLVTLTPGHIQETTG